jgi:CRISPR-associated protein Csx14
MARPRVLISSLGDSPAVVTEAIDKIQAEEGIQLDTVITVRTSHYESKMAEEDVLAEHLLQYYNGRILHVPLCISSYDIDTQEDNLEFLTVVAEQLKLHRSSDVYVSLAGGRKTMSALMALAVQIYGAAVLFHVVHEDVDKDPELQRRMKPKYLRDLAAGSEELGSLLHPPLEKIRLARFPVVSLFPFLNDFYKALSGAVTTDVDGKIRDMLVSSNLIRDDGVALIPTESGKQLLEILEDIRSTPKISEIREKIIINVSTGAETLAGYLARRSEMEPTRIDVDTIRAQIIEIERREGVLGGDAALRHDKNRCRQTLIKICSHIEVEERLARRRRDQQPHS